MTRFTRRPSPAMVVAFAALVAALSGTAVALPGRNTVDSGDLKRGAVKTSDIARNAVTRPKVRNGAINGAKVANNSLTGADIDEGTLGQVPSANQATSANTANSAANAATAGTAGRLTRVTVQREDFQVADNSGNGAVAVCPAGQQALSGGVVTGANDSYITNSRPGPETPPLEDGQTFDRWFGFVFNQPAASGTITSSVFVVCAG
jgi:hypothetical protein